MSEYGIGAGEGGSNMGEREQRQELDLAVRSAQAELAIVREQVEELIDKPWAPSTSAVYAALYVSRADVVKRVATEGKGE